MIADRSVLAIIPARGGSKGLPGKNIAPLGGKPLIAWTIEAALAARRVDRVVLSSDDPAIIEVARGWGCEVPFVRPAELARDETPSVDVVLHALDRLADDPGQVVLLQPTSPLRTAADIDRCIERGHDMGAPACVSVCETAKSPYWTYRLGEGGTLRRVVEPPAAATRRQDLPVTYALNGAVYVADTAWFRRHRAFLGEGTVAFVMPRERSLDIDTRFDLAMAEAVLAWVASGPDGG